MTADASCSRNICQRFGDNLRIHVGHVW